eukprot:GEMP01030094.1.p1 GENE.GEMP01030094.1~~GEMP01030094.1.p1  ORF type:complete len:530 (+),score=172.81 GEMP01030094.1:163-1752(+)
MDKRFKTKGDARFRKPKAALKVQDEDERFAKRFTDESFREGARVDPRGRTRDDDSEVSSESSDSDSEEVRIDDTVWEAPDCNAPRSDESSMRLALMGLDWESIGAEDVLSVCQSAARKPEDVIKVMIFPSEIGLKMLEKEATEGPQFQASTEEEEENPEEAIRKYNLERSTYYYAVAFCENVKVAEYLYDELDGLGVPPLCAGRPLDVRFIPDDLEFPHAHTSEATKVSKTFEAANEEAHARDGLAHSKAICHWDESNPKRKKDLMKKMSTQDIEENDLQVYLASESEDEADEAEIAEKRRLLLGDCAASSDEGVNLEDGEKDEEDDASDFFEAGDTDTESENGEKTATFHPEMDQIVEQVQEKVKVNESGGGGKKSTWEAYLERRKEKKRERKRKAKQLGTDATLQGEEEVPEDAAGTAELELLMHQDGLDRDFNLKKKKRKRDGVEEPDATGFKENLADDRLQKMFEDPDFALDPTHPAFKKSKTMDKFLEKTRQRKKRISKAPANSPAAPVSANAPETKLDLQMFG